MSGYWVLGGRAASLLLRDPGSGEGILQSGLESSGEVLDELAGAIAVAIAMAMAMAIAMTMATAIDIAIALAIAMGMAMAM